MPNAEHQARREAGAERTLYAVACMPWFGRGYLVGLWVTSLLYTPTPILELFSLRPVPPASPLPCVRLLEHLIRQHQEVRGNGQPERLGGLQVDHELELACLLHGQISRCGAL
jgi:hypothetical protein